MLLITLQDLADGLTRIARLQSLPEFPLKDWAELLRVAYFLPVVELYAFLQVQVLPNSFISGYSISQTLVIGTPEISMSSFAVCSNDTVPSIVQREGGHVGEEGQLRVHQADVQVAAGS